MRLTRATRANLSPIFSLYSDPSATAWNALDAAKPHEEWGQFEDGDGTLHRLWRVADADAIETVSRTLADAELLIADGHHRYETSRVYAEEIGGEGDHRYVLMCLVALEDPGLTVFPTHRLVGGLDPERRAALAEAIERDFLATAVAREQIAPAPGSGPLVLGYVDSQRTLRMELRDQAIADAALADMPAAYRRLDTGVLEALLLKGALGLDDEDISHMHDFGYARDAAQALALVDSGTFDVAFLLRPTPVEQVREIAAAGVNMPPKSTYFFPKVPTGLVMNPLA
jgi:uncharacterized protein (DUF1015 family)